MKKILTSLILSLSISTLSFTQQLSASHSALGLSINVIVDTNTDIVDVTITGPIDNWWAYGFGSIGMNGTYAVSTNADGSFAERKLGDFAAGSILASTITADVSTDATIRTLSFSRDRVGVSSDYFTFPNTISTVPIIFANPTGSPAFSYHGSGSQNKDNDAMGLMFSAVVPVEWSNFTLKESNQGVIIDWRTETEVDNKGFVVQRSTDGNKWIDLTFIESENIEGSSYQYLDKRALPGVNYYRLKQMDLDGQINYSVIKSIGYGKRKINPGIHFYPNPVSDFINLKLPADSKFQRVQIRNVNYALMYDQFHQGEFTIRLKVNTLPPGHYILSIQANDWAYNKYFIKQ